MYDKKSIPSCMVQCDATFPNADAAEKLVSINLYFYASFLFIFR
jgi:hypothetical protein